MNAAAQSAVDKVLDAFQQPGSLELVARVFLKAPEVPCSRWSLANRLLTFIAGTDDARGIRQWNHAGRRVKAGTHAFRILAPAVYPIKGADGRPEVDKDGHAVTRMAFVAVPVFRVEDTEGQALPTGNLEPAAPPPLAEVARAWGLDVRYRGFLGSYEGCYNPKEGRITLATHDAHVFFHELAHAADDRVRKAETGEGLHGGQDKTQETVAEFSAAVLAALYGVEQPSRNAFDYIASYAEGKDVRMACLRVLSRVGKALDAILAAAAPVVA